MYVGDDLFDINIMKSVGYSMCPTDAPILVKQVSTTVLSSVGGNNLILELFEQCEFMKVIPTVSFDEVMIKIEELDKSQIF